MPGSKLFRTRRTSDPSALLTLLSAGFLLSGCSSGWLAQDPQVRTKFLTAPPVSDEMLAHQEPSKCLKSRPKGQKVTIDELAGAYVCKDKGESSAINRLTGLQDAVKARQEAVKKAVAEAEKSEKSEFKKIEP